MSRRHRRQQRELQKSLTNAGGLIDAQHPDPDDGPRAKHGRATRQGSDANGTAQRIGKLIDPWAYWGSFGVSLRKPGPITFDVLREVATRCEPVAAIIQTRQNQVAAFSGKDSNSKEPGWHIRLKDKDAKPSEADKKRIAEVEYLMEHMHSEVPEEVTKRLRKGTDYPEQNFEGFLRMIVRDRLTLDAIACEKTRTRDQKLFSVWPLDAARIWRAFPREAKEDGPSNVSAALEALTWMQDRERYTSQDRKDFDEIDFVQEYRGREWVGWNARDFIYAFANPRTDMGCYGYGFSELEMLISFVTAILNAIAYNKSQFTTSSLPPGFLLLFGNYDEEQIEGLIREFQARLQGAENQNRLPILWSQQSGEGGGNKGGQWINMRGTNREMEYNTWLDWLLNIACAVYQIAPEEINIRSWSGGGEAPMFDKGPMAQLKHSKDKGLKPLLRFVAGVITSEIVSEFYDDLVFEFVNIDPEDESVRTDLMTKRLSAGYETVNMARAKNNEAPIKETWADAPANPVLFQIWSQEHMAQQQQAGMGQEAPEDQAQGYKRFLFEPDAGAGDQPPQDTNAAGGGGDSEKAAQAAHQGNGAPPEALNRSGVIVPGELLRKALSRFHRLRTPKESVHADVARAARFFEGWDR